MATIVDSYSEANQSGEEVIYTLPWNDECAVSQSLTGDGQKISSCKFFLKKYGTPGNMIARLYAHSGTFGSSSVPTGAALDSSGVYATTSVGGSFALFEFSGFTGYIMTSGTKYCIVIESYNGTWDGGNCLVVGFDNNSPTHGGNYTRFIAAAWQANSAYDTCFYVYGIPAFSTYTKTYTIDALLKKLGITETLDADTLLKKLGILQTVDADALITQLGITRTFLAKVIFGAANISEITADVLLKALGLTQTLDVDALIQQPDLTQTVDVDTIINLIATQSVDVDALLRGALTKTFTADVRLGEAGAVAFTASVYFKRLAYHVILDGRYTQGSPGINRVYVIGSDAEGNPVYGTDLEQSEIDLVGERLDFTLALSIPTSSKAADVADAILKKQRLSKHRGFITIPTNAGAELWDVIQVTDKLCAQSGSNYRVVAISFDYQPRQRRYQHKLFLAAP